MRQKIIEFLWKNYELGTANIKIQYNEIFQKLVERKKVKIALDFIEEIKKAEKESKNKEEYIKLLNFIEKKYVDKIEKILEK